MTEAWAVRSAIVATMVLAAATAAAQPAAPAPPPAGPSVVVLRLDATAGVDTGLIERVQREVEGRAQRSGLVVTTGAANLTDTASLAGCTSTVAAGCHDQILDALGADELVYGAVDRSMSGHRVTVARAKRKQAPVEVVVDVPAGNLDSAARAMQPGLDKLFPEASGGGAGTGGAGGAGGAGDGNPGGAGTGTTDGAGAGAGRATGAGPEGESTINPRTAILIGGVSVGGALFVIGLLQWNKASSLQDDIDQAPDQTPADLALLLQLEDRAAGYASRGNWLVLAGVAVGGGTAAWWYFTRHNQREAPSTATTLRPWLAPNAAGLTLAWTTP